MTTFYSIVTITVFESNNTLRCCHSKSVANISITTLLLVFITKNKSLSLVFIYFHGNDDVINPMLTTSNTTFIV